MVIIKNELVFSKEQNDKSLEINIENEFIMIKELINKAKNNIYKTVNNEIVNVYWYIGKTIMELQNNNIRAEYGEFILEKFSERLTNEFEKSFSVQNLRRMRQLYNCFRIRSSVPSELSYTHLLEIIKIDDELKRNFYIMECTNCKWSTRELSRQINSLLFERLALSKDKDGVMELAIKGQEINSPNDLVRDPYILEFLDIKQNYKYLEKDLETNLIEHLKEFLLELGKGFAFLGRQQKIKIGDSYFYVDLLFYNRLAKCFILIDLKIGKLTHQDIGQMQMYVNYYKRDIMIEDENPPIGIILCADKDDAVVKYTLAEDDKANLKNTYLMIRYYQNIPKILSCILPYNIL